MFNLVKLIWINIDLTEDAARVQSVAISKEVEKLERLSHYSTNLEFQKKSPSYW
jgi:hypothetical protein